MKALLISILTLVTVPSAFANSDRIGQVVDSLSKWTYGIVEHKVGANDGILSARAALEMFTDFALSEKNPTNRQTAALRSMFGALERAGAVFAYGSYGASVCGTTWPALIILDVEGEVAYEVLFAGGGC